MGDHEFKESENQELKSSFSDWKAIIISLAAFANRKGGQVLVGLDDNGKSTNLQVGKSTIEDFVNKLRNHTDPVLYPSINVKTFGLGEIVSIQIPESDQKPVFAFDRAYIRVGKTNIKLNASEVRKIVKAYTLPDYDESVLNKSRENIELDTDMIISLNKQYFKFKELSSDEILNRLEVIKDDKLTNAGYLCFAKKIRYIPAASIKAARFKGNSMSTFIDMKDFDSNLISSVDDILDFVSRHINMKVVINGDSRRKELWDYPIAALREAVINAVVHRDYADPGNIQVRIFDDIIEVWSPGRLPKEIDICKLLTENRSIPRNRNLARIFYQVGLIENWGTGFHRMAEACRKNGNPLPLFEEKTGAFVITFKKRNGNEGINEGLNEGINEGLNEGLNKLFFHIATHPGERLTEISNQLDIPKKTLERWIKELKEEEKINFKGSKRNGGYHVSNTASK